MQQSNILRLPLVMAVAGLVLGGCTAMKNDLAKLFQSEAEINESEISALARMETAAGPAHEHPAADYILRLGDDVIGKLQDSALSKEQRVQYFEGVLARDLDIPMIGRFAFGTQWRETPAEKQKAYMDAFAGFILNTYSSRLGGAQVDKISVADVKNVGENDILVRTSVSREGGKPLSADWRLRDNKGKFQIVDLAVEGISMAMMLRQEFAAVLRSKGSVDGLIDSLKQRSS